MFISSRNWIHGSHLDKRISTYLIVHLWLLSRVFYNLIRAAFWRASNCTGVVFKSSWRRAVYWKACVHCAGFFWTANIFHISKKPFVDWLDHMIPGQSRQGQRVFWAAFVSGLRTLVAHTLSGQPTNQESRAYSPWVTFVTCPALPAGQLRTPHNSTCTTWPLSICLPGGLLLPMLRIISINQRVNVFGDNQILSDLFSGKYNV